jgi:hypothetical protein
MMLKLVDCEEQRKHSRHYQSIIATDTDDRYTVRVGKGKRPINFNVMLLNRTVCTEAQKIFYGENTFEFLGKFHDN